MIGIWAGGKKFSNNIVVGTYPWLTFWASYFGKSFLSPRMSKLSLSPPESQILYEAMRSVNIPWRLCLPLGCGVKSSKKDNTIIGKKALGELTSQMAYPSTLGAMALCPNRHLIFSWELSACLDTPLLSYQGAQETRLFLVGDLGWERGEEFSRMSSGAHGVQWTLQTDPLHAGVAKEDETWPRSGSDTQAKIEWRWGKKCVYFCDFPSCAS